LLETYFFVKLNSPCPVFADKTAIELPVVLGMIQPGAGEC
jgi:hypothetical protein